MARQRSTSSYLASRHTIRERDAIGHLSRRTIRRDESDHAWGELLTGHQVKAAAVDVGVSAAIDDDLVPWAVRDALQVGMGDKRPVRLPAEKTRLTRRADEQAAVSQPVE